MALGVRGGVADRVQNENRSRRTGISGTPWPSGRSTSRVRSRRLQRAPQPRASDALGLYKTIQAQGPMTSMELARAAKVDEPGDLKQMFIQFQTKTLHDPFQGGQPRRNEVVVVGRPEVTGDRAEHAAGLVAPSNAGARFECRLHLGLIVEHSHRVRQISVINLRRSHYFRQGRALLCAIRET